jgi:threonyl-tRNA synthetase
MNITIKDGSVKEYDGPQSIHAIAISISEGLGRMALGGLVNDEVVDLRYVVDTDAEVSILTFNDKAGQKVFWHSSSHLLAQAVKRLYPDTKLAIGPAIDNGFYYDFDTVEPFTTETLEKIEAEMKVITKENLDIERFELPRDEAIALMAGIGEDYKVELINDLPEDEVISFYKQGDFVDLCAGPHLFRTKDMKAFKLMSVAGAYWRGSEKT